ncbi:putative Ig domain-containing protein, partial [Pseudoalteromonas sp. SMS1]|uniref:putative Ig domain-containing protein n=1 Tax=Pseudoalteromonas sp. SMS1 TaxID=2908894 RepID=UPI001F377C85
IWRVTADELFDDLAGEGMTLSDLKVQYRGTESGPQFEAAPFMLSDGVITVKRRSGSKSVRIPAGEYRFTVTGHSKHAIGGGDTTTFVVNIEDNVAPHLLRRSYTVNEGSDELDMKYIVGDTEGDDVIFNMSELSGLSFGSHPFPSKLYSGAFVTADYHRLMAHYKFGFDYNSEGVYHIAGTYEDYYNLTPQQFSFDLTVLPADQPIFFQGGFSDWHFEPNKPLSQHAEFDVNVIKDKVVENDNEDTVSYSLIFKNDISKISLGGHYNEVGKPIYTDSYTTHKQIQDMVLSGEIGDVANQLGIVIDPMTGVLSGAIKEAYAGSVTEVYVLAHSSGEIRPAVAPIKVQVSGAIHLAVQKGSSYSIPITSDMHGFEQLKNVSVSGNSKVSLNHSKTQVIINTDSSDATTQSFKISFEDGGPIEDHIHGQDTSNSIGGEHADFGDNWHAKKLSREFTFKVSDIIVDSTVQEHTKRIDLKDIDDWSFTKSQLDTVFGDKDNDPLTYSIVSKPDWVVWDSNAQSLRTAEGKNPDGYHEVKVKAVDPSSGDYAIVTLAMVVEDTNNAPVVSREFGPYYYTEGDNISLDFKSFFREIDGQDLSFKIYAFDPVSDASMMPPGLSASNGVLSGKLGFNSEGKYGLSVTASDGESQTTHTTYITVHHANQSVIDLSGKEGQTTETLFTKSITGLDAISRVELIGAPSFVSVLSGNRGLYFRPSYAQSGTYSFSVKLYPGEIQHPHSVSNAAIFTPDVRTIEYKIIVNNSNRAPTAKRASTTVGMQNNRSWSYSKAQINALFNDLDGDTLTYSIVSKPSWVSWNSSSQSLSVGSQLKPVGNHTIRVKAQDSSGAAAYTNIVLNLSDSNRAPTSSPFTIIYPTAGRAMLPISFSRFFSDPDGDALTYRISFVKNDGADTSVSIPSGLNFSSSGVLSGTPRFSGNYKLTVTASDGKKSTSRSGNFNILSGSGVGIGGGDNSFSMVNTFSAASSPSFSRSASVMSVEMPADQLTEVFKSGTEAASKPSQLRSTPLVDVTPNVMKSLPIAESAVMSAPVQARFSAASVSVTPPVTPASATPSAMEQYWFTYDANNRVVMDGAQLVGGQVSISS